MPSTRYAGLSREKVLAAALELADRDGLDRLSIRGVASALGVTPMALSRHVPSKDALVDGLGDLALAGLDLPDGSGDWRDELRTTARSLNAILNAHPAAREVFRSRPLSTPEAVKTTDAMLALLRGAGFPPEEAARRYGQVARILVALVSPDEDAFESGVDLLVGGLERLLER